MRCAAAAILLLIVGVSSVTVNHRRRFPGNYCLTRRPQQCCPGRDDTCTVPLKDTLCYCDQFCAIHNAEDCCPDYDDVCAEKPVTVRPQEPDNQCIFEGRVYQAGQSVKKECNQCLCVLQNTVNPIQVWQCETEVCINNQDLVNRINSGRYGWTAATYDKFNGDSVRDGLGYYLGTDKPRSEVVRLNPLQIDPEERFSTYFDAREKWPDSYIHPAMDQGQCASSWAFSTASVAADRWSIQSQGQFQDQMAVQSVISCNRFIDGCNGASVVDAWFYLQNEGAVGARCYPYTSGTTKVKGTCKYLEDLNCDDYHEHKTTPPYRIAADERQIMKEIQSQGPVQALITVHPDFYLYERGVYKHSRQDEFATLSGTHSVKIIGWGEENGVKYWRCVNSWGVRWGEDGMFRIVRGENESGIEEFVVGVWARVEQHDLFESKARKHRRRH